MTPFVRFVRRCPPRLAYKQAQKLSRYTQRNRGIPPASDAWAACQRMSAGVNQGGGDVLVVRARVWWRFRKKIDFGLVYYSRNLVIC